MSASTTPLPTVLGTQTIDRSVVPVIESIQISVTSYDLKPGAVAHYWFDDKNIDLFVQPASILGVNVGFNANSFSPEEGIYCPYTHGYAVVQENSQNKYLQLSEDYISLNLSSYGSNTLLSTQYLVNDIIYQANNQANVYANTMIGRVVFWDNANSTLVITAQQGTVNIGSSSNVLFKIGSTKLANVVSVVAGNKFPTGCTVVSTSNTSKFFLANTYNPNHGVVTKSNTGSVIQISGLSPNVNVVGNTIYIVRGTGLGEVANIIAWNSTASTVNIDTTWTVAGNSYYGIGSSYVDAIGVITGLFNVPEDINYNFQSGNRLITVNDSANSATDNNATMRSTATFVAAGQLPIGTAVTPVVPPTPPLSPAANSTVAPSAPTAASINNNNPINNPAMAASPMVQTFFTPQANTSGTDYGCFATSVNLFFQSIPTGNSTQFPVTVYLVTTVNGYPTSNVLGISTIRCEAINVTDGNVSFPNAANSSTYTNFPFVDPVYLEPGTEYGIMLYSESPNYNVWVSQTGNTIINGTSLISKAPYVGSFFKAQNASTWNPIPNEQLMFVVNKAAFNTNPTTWTFSVVPPVQNTYMDLVTLHSSDLTFPVANLNYSVQSTTANSGVTDSYNSIGSDVPFYYGGDLINSSLNSDRRRLIQQGNANSVLVKVTALTTNPDVAPMFHSEALNLISFGNIINAGGISQDDISILTPGAHLNVANITVTFSAPTGDGGVNANGYISLTNVIGASPTLNIVSITIDNPGAGYVTSPTITISEPLSSLNATAVITGEDGVSGGNGNARYITRPITLADGFDSGDIVAYIQAVRPQGTDISVYYKVLSAADTQQISNVSWVLLSKQNDIFSPDQQTPINLVHNTGTNSLGIPNGTVNYVHNGTTYPLGGKFKTFQIKVVLTANDPTVPPEVQSLRIVAVPQG
jgi:hypothetical protein